MSSSTTGWFNFDILTPTIQTEREKLLESIEKSYGPDFLKKRIRKCPAGGGEKSPALFQFDLLSISEPTVSSEIQPVSDEKNSENISEPSDTDSFEFQPVLDEKYDSENDYKSVSKKVPLPNGDFLKEKVRKCPEQGGEKSPALFQFDLLNISEPTDADSDSSEIQPVSDSGEKDDFENGYKSVIKKVPLPNGEIVEIELIFGPGEVPDDFESNPEFKSLIEALALENKDSEQDILLGFEEIQEKFQSHHYEEHEAPAPAGIREITFTKVSENVPEVLYNTRCNNVNEVEIENNYLDLLEVKVQKSQKLQNIICRVDDSFPYPIPSSKSENAISDLKNQVGKVEQIKRVNSLFDLWPWKGLKNLKKSGTSKKIIYPPFQSILADPESSEVNYYETSGAAGDSNSSPRSSYYNYDYDYQYQYDSYLKEDPDFEDYDEIVTILPPKYRDFDRNSSEDSLPSYTTYRTIESQLQDLKLKSKFLFRKSQDLIEAPSENGEIIAPSSTTSTCTCSKEKSDSKSQSSMDIDMDQDYFNSTQIFDNSENFQEPTEEEITDFKMSTPEKVEFQNRVFKKPIKPSLKMQNSDGSNRVFIRNSAENVDSKHQFVFSPSNTSINDQKQDLVSEKFDKTESKSTIISQKVDSNEDKNVRASSRNRKKPKKVVESQEIEGKTQKESNFKSAIRKIFCKIGFRAPCSTPTGKHSKY